MIVLRNKKFSQFDSDNFGGLKARLRRNRNLKPLGKYEHQGPWTVKLSENAEDEFNDEEYWSASDLNKVSKILKEIETRPYQGSFEQHPLWEFYDNLNEFVIWSAKINEEDRLNYVIFKKQNYILVINLMGHHVMDVSYANRPKI